MKQLLESILDKTFEHPLEIYNSFTPISEKDLANGFKDAPEKGEKFKKELMAFLGEAKSKISKIVIIRIEGTSPDGIWSIEFYILYDDGKKVRYRSEASPYFHRTFINYVNKKFYGRAINLVKPFTKRVEENEPQ